MSNHTHNIFFFHILFVIFFFSSFLPYLITSFLPSFFPPFNHSNHNPYLLFKILNGQAPRYLTELPSYHKPTRCLRFSSDTTRLVLHSFATAIGDKRFPTVAAKSWNLLPIEIRTVTSVVTFKKLLKTYLF